MKRYLLVVAVAVAGMSVAACEKPAANDCRMAIQNMLKLMGNDSTTKASDVEATVRLCRGGSSREAVSCAIKAATLAELKACDFMTGKAAK